MVCIDEEIPFEIPAGWEWCRLKHVAEIARGGSPRPIKEYITESPDGINWIKIGDTEKGGKYINQTKEKIKPSGVKHSRMVHRGDFLLTNSMSFGRPYILNVEGCIHDGWLVISPQSQSFQADYLYYLLSSPFAYGQFSSVVAGAVVQNLNSDKVASSLFPLPPTNEQRRIAEYLDEIMPRVDVYSSLEEQKEKLNAHITEKLKKSILQEAIQGKLVSQNSTDEPSSVLLGKIAEEKNRMVKEGKLKAKDAVSSVIYKGEDNKYYEKIGDKVVEVDTPYVFPDSWSVARLKDICLLCDGEKRKGQEVLLDAKYLRGKSSAEYISEGKYVEAGDDIILVDGENSGEVFTVPVSGYMGSTFKKLWISTEMYRPFVLSFLLFYKDELRNSKKGAAIPHLNKDVFQNIIIGVPSLEEQKRIQNSITSLQSLL